MKFLVACDGQRHSLEAARFLTRFNLSGSDEIRLLHVINFVPLLHEVEDYSEVIYNLKQEVAPKILDEAMEIVKETTAVLSTTVLEGETVERIIDAATEWEADLIVMGSKGLRGWKSILLGSVARNVVIKARVPVLVIRESQWHIKGPLKVLFTTDGSEYASSAAEVLRALPLPFETEVTIIHVVQSAVLDIPERLYMEIDDSVKERVAEIRQREFSTADVVIERAQEILSDRYPIIRTVTKVGDPSTEILSFADNMNSDIIVTGCRGLRGMKGLLGSVSRDVMRYAKSSFLIAKRC